MPPNVVTLSNCFGSNGVGIATTSKIRLETVETLDEVVQGRLDDYITSL